MALDDENINTLEKQKFKLDTNSDVAVNTVIGGGELRLVGMNTAILITNTTVTNSAAAIPTTALTNRNSMIIYNKGTSPIYLGPSNVTTSGALEGWIVDAGSYFSIDITDDVSLYAIADSTIDVKIMEMA